jgi:hypothetical protein
MIAMQVTHADHVDIVGGEPEPIHADQRGDAAIDEKGGAVRPYVEGGLELPARAKSVPTPYDCKPHDRRTPPPVKTLPLYETPSAAAIHDGRFGAERR